MYKIYLEQLGLSEKEAEIYLALNSYGASPASTIARLTKIKRGSVYDGLNSLIARNLVSSFKKGAYTYFVIDDIKKLLHQAKEKVRLAERVMTGLEEDQNHEGFQINHYVGEEGYRDMYEHILRVNPKEIMVWMHWDEFYSALDPNREDDWTNERIKKKLFARLLMQDTPLAKEFKKKDKECYRETILLPKDYYFESNCVLYGGYITFFDAAKKITGIRIRHPRIYEMHKQIFEMNWKLFR